MTRGPFLSHKREDHEVIENLKFELGLRGVVGWLDTHDLRLGRPQDDELRRVIKEDVEGFIWWGTRVALTSAIINDVEIPAAFERTTIEPRFPLVPVFVDVDPKRDAALLGNSLAMMWPRLGNLAGLVKAPDEGLPDFVRRTARRYVADAVSSLNSPPVSVGITVFRPPAPGPDLWCDWRGCYDQAGNVASADAVRSLTAALVDLREALQSHSSAPDLHLEIDLPMPLGYLIGFAFRLATRVRLTVNQRSSTSRQQQIVVTPPRKAADAVFERVKVGVPSRPRRVVVVSSQTRIDGEAVRYCQLIGGAEVATLHQRDRLTSSDVCRTAVAVARELESARDSGIEAHLIVRGPVALAVAIGAFAGTAGDVILPFWTGTGYASPIVVGPSL